MYVCVVITYSKSMDQPGKVANPARGQLKREKTTAVYFVGLHVVVGGIRIQLSEVKFLDLRKTNYCESIYQGCMYVTYVCMYVCMYLLNCT